MRTSKRLFLAVSLLLIVSTVIISGCAGAPAPTPTSAPPAKPATTPAATPAGAPQPTKAPAATPAAQAQPAGTVKIGAAGPFSGQLSKIGQDSLNAVKFAVDEINAAGGVGGMKIEVVEGDDGADPAKAATVAEKFGTDSSIVGVIGPMTSGAVNASLPVYQKYNLVIISQSATNPNLTEQGFKVMHRICPRDDDQGPAAAMFIAQDLKLKSVYLLDGKDTYSAGLAGEVEKKLKELGVTIAGHDQYAPEDKDFSTLLTRIKSAKPDMIYMPDPDPSHAAMFLKQAADLGVKAKFMTGEAGYEKAEFIDKSGGAAEGAYLTNIGPILTTIPEAKGFIKNFTAKYGGMSVFAGQSYEATKILAEAIKKSIKNGKVSREDVLSAVHNTKDYKGILGAPIGFNDKGDLVSGTIFVYQVKNGDFTQLKSVSARGR
ncbi:MAG: branched-chain amino acid ABC transporter substrate-binding protein [Dehalococcoidales bacterium]|nr:branched-chain amino acid ABC transporter substrate-binding protein [Dehalococcoidales bacterium]